MTGGHDRWWLKVLSVRGMRPVHETRRDPMHVGPERRGATSTQTTRTTDGARESASACRAQIIESRTEYGKPRPVLVLEISPAGHPCRNGLG
jgi:hypothetical protein